MCRMYRGVLMHGHWCICICAVFFGLMYSYHSDMVDVHYAVVHLFMYQTHLISSFSVLQSLIHDFQTILTSWKVFFIIDFNFSFCTIFHFSATMLGLLSCKFFENAVWSYHMISWLPRLWKYDWFLTISKSVLRFSCCRLPTFYIERHGEC